MILQRYSKKEVSGSQILLTLPFPSNHLLDLGFAILVAEREEEVESKKRVERCLKTEIIKFSYFEKNRDIRN